MRFLLGVAFAFAACASAPQEPQSSAGMTLPAAVVGQEAETYAGFTARLAPADLGKPYTETGVHLRQDPQYVALTQGLVEHIGPALRCTDYLRVQQVMLERLQAQGLGDRPDGRRALAILHGIVGQARARLAAYGDQPLAKARAEQVELVAGAETTARDLVPTPGATWVVRGFGGSPHVPIPVSATATDGAGNEVWHVYLGAEVAYGIATFFDFVDRLQKAVIDVDAAIVDLNANAEAWENYQRRGYAQFPWENLANSWLVSSAWDRAPSDQIVLLHPEPGVVFDVDRVDSADLNVGLLVHGLGYIHYFGTDRSWFCGASATGCVTGDEGNGFGYGVTLHLGSTLVTSRLPHMSVGLLWHDGRDDDGLQVSLGIDLLRLFDPK